MSTSLVGAALAVPALARVTIIGAGAEGTWLAERASRAGYQVTLEDLISAKRRVAAQQLAGSVTYASSVEEAAREADLIIDFVPDELESKLEILSLLDRMAPPHTIFATPTRSLSIADLASCTYRPERCVALRSGDFQARSVFTVEVVNAPQTLKEVADAVVAFWTSLGAEVTSSVDHAPLP
jgi:3-hydroxybutyryl-CoA dehydrogenase